jgi:hypothetical protein
MDEKKLEIYYDHYKDTFQHQVRYIENRNKYFFISLVLIALLFFLITDPNTVNGAVGNYVKKEIGDNIIFDFAYINTFLLFGLLWVLILYYQITLTIEKQYKYLWILEEELSKSIQPFTISRESKFYLKVKPTYAKWISKIYKLLFPLSIAFAVLSKFIIELFYERRFDKPSFWMDLLLCILIITITLLFTYWQNKERKQK